MKQLFFLFLGLIPLLDNQAIALEEVLQQQAQLTEYHPKTINDVLRARRLIPLVGHIRTPQDRANHYAGVLKVLLAEDTIIIEELQIVLATVRDLLKGRGYARLVQEAESFIVSQPTSTANLISSDKDMQSMAIAFYNQLDTALKMGEQINDTCQQHQEEILLGLREHYASIRVLHYLNRVLPTYKKQTETSLSKQESYLKELQDLEQFATANERAFAKKLFGEDAYEKITIAQLNFQIISAWRDMKIELENTQKTCESLRGEQELWQIIQNSLQKNLKELHIQEERERQEDLKRQELEKQIAADREAMLKKETEKRHQTMEKASMSKAPYLEQLKGIRSLSPRSRQTAVQPTWQS